MKLKQTQTIQGQSVYEDRTGRHWTRKASFGFLKDADDPDEIVLICAECKEEIDLWTEDVLRCSECGHPCRDCADEHGYVYLTTGKPELFCCEHCVEPGA